MNPYKLKNVFEYLTSNNQLLKKKLQLGTSQIPIPPKRQDVLNTEVINRFNKANPRVDTTNLKPLSVKQSNVKNPEEPNMKVEDDGFLDEALGDYNNYLGMRKARPPKKRYKEIPFKKFLGEYSKENRADGGRAGYEDGGMLVQPSDDGSRPGYKGGQPKKYDPKKVLEAIENSNSKLKYNTLEMLANQLDGVSDSSHLHLIIKREKFPKLDSYANKAERAFLELFDNPNNTPQQLKKPLHKIADMMELSENTKLKPNLTRGIRIDNISEALKKSKLFNYAEDVKPLIDKLSNVNFIKKLDRASENKNPWTMEDIYFSIDNKTSLRGPQGDAERLMQYVIRHNTQAGKKATFTLIDNKTGQKIKNTSNIERYLDVSFKDPSGKIYDMDYLERNGRKDPMFKEYFENQDKLTDMKGRTTWPDGSLIIDAKGKNVTFGTYAGDMYTHGYGYTNPYRRFPYDIDHSDLKKHPFKNLQVLPTRINVATGAADNWNKPDIKKKIGTEYFRQLPVDDLMMKEKALGEKILIFDEEGKHVGKKLNTSYAAAKIKSNLEITPKKANILSAFCGRKGLKSGTGSLACSMEEIQTNMQKQIDQAAKVSKDGKIPRKFGKLRGFANAFFGDIAIPLEYMFAAPYLAAGDIEGAKRASTAGLLGYGKVDLDKLPEGEGQRFLKHINALNSYMDNYQTKTTAENDLEKSKLSGTTESDFMITDRIAQAQTNMDNIATDYSNYGYDGQKGILQGKVAAQQLIRDQVQSDYNKKIKKATSTQFFKDSDPELLKQNILSGDEKFAPDKVTPITDLESYIRNKGEATAGNTNLFFDVKPYTLNRAEALGAGDIFDTYAGGYAGVETPGFIRETGEVDMGTKDVRDAYSSLPVEYASQLAALEKKELEEGMLKKDIEQRLTGSDPLQLASGGLANLMKKYND